MKPKRFLLATLFLAAGLTFAQSLGRVTPLGTQRPKTVPADPTKKDSDKKESASEIVERAAGAHGGRSVLNSVRDSVSEGKLTFFTDKTAKNTIDVTVTRKGGVRVQRVLKEGGGELHQGTDGVSTWESFNGMTALAPGGLAGNYIESETLRAVENLFNFQGKGATVRDAGRRNNARVVELESAVSGKAPRKTKYLVDDATSRVTAIEFATGEGKDLLGKVVPRTESYVFSDFRVVQGIPTPFRIERFVDGLKIEETQFTTVRYNASIKDDFFKP